MKRFRLLLILLLFVLNGCSEQPQSEQPVTRLVIDPACDMEKGCEASDENISLRIQFVDRPRALQPFALNVFASGEEIVQDVYVRFAMQGMDMGMNRYRLLGDAAGGWKADVTLPICVSGRSDWTAEFEIVTARRSLRVDLPFVLGK